ncbi:uncharacterized protein LOC124363000 [Homalodisca vitripennis]|uniref:uncharacterized protein LOC124363000 n=1 Tax=Homalodisca vitripennis TaxID=197043 RepID=UPI001EEC94CB|nr:uncharacterized protein LOC124363000 [Homalodisca vitripennis]
MTSAVARIGEIPLWKSSEAQEKTIVASIELTNVDNPIRNEDIEVPKSDSKIKIECNDLLNIDGQVGSHTESSRNENYVKTDNNELPNIDCQVDSIKSSNSVDSSELPNNVNQIKTRDSELLNIKNQVRVTNIESPNSYAQSKIDNTKLSNSKGKTQVGSPELPNNVNEIKIASIESLSSKERVEVGCTLLNGDNQSKVDASELSSINGRIEVDSPELFSSVDGIKISSIESIDSKGRVSSSNGKTEVGSTDSTYNAGQIKISSVMSLSSHDEIQVKADSIEFSIKSPKTDDGLVKTNSSESLIDDRKVDIIKSSKSVKKDQDKVGIIESSNGDDQAEVAIIELHHNEDLASDNRIKSSNSDVEVNVANIKSPHDKVSRIESTNSNYNRFKDGSIESSNSQAQVEDLSIEHGDHVKVHHAEPALNKDQIRISRIESSNSHEKIKFAKIELACIESYGEVSRLESTNKDDQPKASRESSNSVSQIKDFNNESVKNDDQVVTKELPHRSGEDEINCKESSMSNGLLKVGNPQLGPGVEFNKDGTIKRKRGRPRKYKISNDTGLPQGSNTESVNIQGQANPNTQLEPTVKLNEDGTPKRGRGRPRKRKPGRPKKDPNSDDEWRPVNSFVEPPVDSRVLRLKSEMKNNFKRLVQGSDLAPEIQTLKNDSAEDREDCCCVLTCPNTADSCRLVSFPIEPKRKRRWMVRIGRPNWSPSQQSRICEVHFEPKMWMTHGDGSVVLRPEALPTMFMKQENNIKPFFTCDRSGGLIATRGQSILQKEFCRSKKMRDAIEAVAEGMPFLSACQTFNIKRLKLMMRYCRTLGIKTSPTRKPKAHSEQKTAPPVFVEEMVVDEPRVFIKSEVLEPETRVENEMDPEEMNVFIKSESLEPEIEVTEAEGSSAELFETVFCDTNMDHQEVNVHPMAQHPPSLQVKAQFNQEPESVLPDVVMSPERGAECATATSEMSVDPIAPVVNSHLSLAESLPIPKLSSLPVECQVCKRVLSCRRNWVHHLIRLHPDEEITKRLIVEREARRLSIIKKPTISSSSGTITSILGSLLSSATASRDKSTDTGGLPVSAPLSLPPPP